MAAHALLSPSGASRWIACTPSARLEAQFPDTTSSAAKEGTLAHSLGELIIRYRLGRVSKAGYTRDLKKIQKAEFYSVEMLHFMEEYADYVIEEYNAIKAVDPSAQIYLETKADLTAYIEDGFGTVDIQIIGANILRTIDLKYGKGVPVFAPNNKQLMIYALGILDIQRMLYDFDTVHLTIYQPRLDTISDWEISVAELIEWSKEVLIPAAKQAYAGTGELIAGDHCQFCRARATCKANADLNLELLKYDFMAEKLLSRDEIADILTKVDSLVKWASSIKDYALTKALEGEKYPGFKLVVGRSNRTITDIETATKLLTANGFTDITKPAALKPLGELESLVGKKELAVLLKDVIVKPDGKPTLAPASDKRDEYSPNTGIISDFKKLN